MFAKLTFNSEIYQLYYKICHSKSMEIQDSRVCVTKWLTSLIYMCFIMDDTTGVIKRLHAQG